MSSTIKSIRLSQGISVNDLAARLGVTPSAVSQLERSEVDGTIKLNTLRDALAALGSTLRIGAARKTAMSQYAPFMVGEAAGQALLENHNQTYVLRLLTHATHELRTHAEMFDSTELETPPTPLPDKRWDTFMRALYSEAIPGKKPAWTQTQRLPEPWFMSQFPSLKKRAESHTPEYLRKLNIFIDEKSLSHA